MEKLHRSNETEKKKSQSDGLAEIAPDGSPPGRQSGTASPPGLTYPEGCVSSGLSGYSTVLPSSPPITIDSERFHEIRCQRFYPQRDPD
jgi:hypothetical protein